MVDFLIVYKVFFELDDSLNIFKSLWFNLVEILEKDFFSKRLS
uniref:Uncharacterized protein n=1 Tax=Prochlorococcus marinus str. P0902-H212 TaxID=1620696 RepID=A0A0D5A2S8_PROMR|nr:hypothetical protein FA02_0446 [Prochlorococcus marinus str. P0902-H212]